MNLFSENVIPGRHGKTFETNAKETGQLNKIRDSILKIEGIEEVIVNENAFPIELEVHTNEIVRIDKIQEKAESHHIHLLPKTLFPLWSTSIENDGYAG